MSWRDAKIACDWIDTRDGARDAIDKIRRMLASRGISEDDISRFLYDVTNDLQSEAMRRHYTNGEARESVDAWYAAAVREKLAAEGLT